MISSILRAIRLERPYAVVTPAPPVPFIGGSERIDTLSFTIRPVFPELSLVCVPVVVEVLAWTKYEGESGE